jgi:hypothetical protein
MSKARLKFPIKDFWTGTTMEDRFWFFLGDTIGVVVGGQVVQLIKLDWASPKDKALIQRQGKISREEVAPVVGRYGMSQIPAEAEIYIGYTHGNETFTTEG